MFRRPISIPSKYTFTIYLTKIRHLSLILYGKNIQFVTGVLALIYICKLCHPEPVSGSESVPCHPELGSGSKPVLCHPELVSGSKPVLCHPELVSGSK